MKATPKFDEEFGKWTVEVELDDGEIIPVGQTINKEIGLFDIVKWNTKEEAEEWIKGLKERNLNEK